MNSVIVRSSQASSGRPNQTTLPPEPAKQRSWGLTRCLRMHRVLALTVGTGMFLLIVLAGSGVKPSYEASALVYVQPMKAKQLADLTAATYDPARYDSYIEQQLQTVVRADTLGAALKEAAEVSGTVVRPSPMESEEDAIADLQSNLKVVREMGSYQISISLKGRDPAVTTTLVNAVADAYINQERLDELAQSDQQLKLLSEERQRIQEDMDRDRQEQARLSTELGVVDPVGGNPFDTQLQDLRTQLDQARSAHSVAESQLASLGTGGGESSTALNTAAEESIATDPGMAALKQSMSQRRSALAIQMAGLTSKNPLYKQDQDEMAQLDKSLDSMAGTMRAKAAQQLQNKLRLEVARTGDIEARLASQLQRQTATATGATPKLQRASVVSSDIARLQARYAEVDNVISALQMEHASSGLVHLLLHATQPTQPLTNKKALLMAAALPFGIGFGIFAALLRQKLDSHVYIASDVAGILQFPPMAVLPKWQQVSVSVHEEFMLRLVAGVDQAHCLGGARTYIFTATSPDTDVSGIVASLASRMDRIGYRTLMLKTTDLLQVSSFGGNDAPDDWSTSQSGSSETRLAKLNGESFVAENLDRIKQSVDILFIEALPFLSSAETEFAARLADVTVIVAESGKTTRKELANSLDMARRLGVSGLAAILAELDLKNADDEFIAFVKNVVARQGVAGRRDQRSSMGDKSGLSVYAKAEPIEDDYKVPTRH